MKKENSIIKFEEFIKKIDDSKIIKELQLIFSLFFPALKKVFIVFIIFLILFTFFSGTIFDFIKSLIPASVELVAFSPSEVFVSIITITISFSLAFTLPFFLFELSKIILPALYENERRAFIKIIPISFILLTIGTIFGIIVMAYFGLSFFADFGNIYGVKNFWGLGQVINSFISMGLGFGIAFEFPLLMVFLIKFQIIHLKHLIKIRKYVIVFLLIIAAILTPPDVISQLIMFIPLYLLYEGTLIYLKVINK